jgi:hypothetical protein
MPVRLTPFAVARPACSIFNFSCAFPLPSVRQHPQTRGNSKDLKKGKYAASSPPSLKGTMNLSVETKVAIAVATGFVVLIVGAMAQG